MQKLNLIETPRPKSRGIHRYKSFNSTETKKLSIHLQLKSQRFLFWWSKIQSSPLFKGSLILVFANTFGNFLNYFYHLISGRFLTSEDYGLLQSLIALTYFLGVILESISFSIIKAINKINTSQIQTLVKYIFKKLWPYALTLWIFTLAIYPLTNKFLHINNFFYYFLFSIQIITAILGTICATTLSAKLQFAKFSILGLISSISKILTLTILLLIGFRVTATLISLIIPGVIIILLGFIIVKKTWPNSNLAIKNPNFQFKKNSLKNFIVSLSLTSLISSDILLVRYFLSQYDSGIYAATSITGKIIFFISGPIILVAFSIFNKDKSSSKKTFLQSISFITLISLFTATLFSLSPNFFLSLLYKSKFSEASQLIPYFSIFAFLISIFNFTIKYLLSKEVRQVALITLIPALTQIILITIYHQNLREIIINSIIAVSLGLILSSYSVIKVLNINKNPI